LKPLWQRSDLSKRDCSIGTLSAIIARNHTVELGSHLNYCFETTLLKDCFWPAAADAEGLGPTQSGHSALPMA
jgi:hypothetical protein